MSLLSFTNAKINGSAYFYYTNVVIGNADINRYNN